LPATALNHFQQDIDRAQALNAHADRLPTGTADERILRSDILRSAWMFAVGALDAYFCDAYTDIVAATIISKNRQPAIVLPGFFYEIRFPVRAILEPYTNKENWRWRMAARRMMDRENVLKLKTIQDLFNKFFRPDHKLFRDLIGDWIVELDAKKRLFGITPAQYRTLPPAPGNQRQTAIADAWEQMQDRYRDIFQRRHDCIHNCDRPKVSPQSLNRSETVLKVIQDIKVLVRRCDGHIQTEFRQFLLSTGCSSATIAQVGY
jgi:hypothetical protein